MIQRGVCPWHALLHKFCTSLFWASPNEYPVDSLPHDRLLMQEVLHASGHVASHRALSVQAKDAAVDVRLWKKRHAQARVRREYRTADEVLAEAAERPQAAPKQTIIDMRGPQVQTPPELLSTQGFLIAHTCRAVTATMSSCSTCMHAQWGPPYERLWTPAPMEISMSYWSLQKGVSPAWREAHSFW